MEVGFIVLLESKKKMISYANRLNYDLYYTDIKGNVIAYSDFETRIMLIILSRRYKNINTAYHSAKYDCKTRNILGAYRISNMGNYPIKYVISHCFDCKSRKVMNDYIVKKSKIIF